jgi:CubicO group peptidase (beta-lactamase class C family)
MSTGSDTLRLLASTDMAAYAADFPLNYEPGTFFEYNSGSTVLLDRMIGEMVGDGQEDMRAFMDERLFDPLGMDPVHTAFDDVGTWAGWYSADTTARDFAKFGLLYLRGGEWDGDQLLPEEWVEYSRTPSEANAEYGAHWWLDPTRPELMHAIGVQGQVITVDTEHDLVIVQLSTVGGTLPLEQTEAILEAFGGID